MERKLNNTINIEDEDTYFYGGDTVELLDSELDDDYSSGVKVLMRNKEGVEAWCDSSFLCKVIEV